MGGGSNTEYNKKAGYLQDQKEFQENNRLFKEGDDVGKEWSYGSFSMTARLQGKNGSMIGRELEGPAAVSKQEQWDSNQTTMYAATIAHDWLGNKRAVNVCKQSAMMKRGFKPNMNPIRFNYVWRAWAFRANFMFKSVL